MHRSQRNAGPGVHFWRVNRRQNRSDVQLVEGLKQLTTFLALGLYETLVGFGRRQQDLVYSPA